MSGEHMNLNAMQPCETQFIDRNCVTLHNAEDYCINDKNECQDKANRKDCIVHIFSRTYAQLLAIIAVIAVLVEIVHGAVPLNTIHVYVYLYLLIGSIFIFISSFMTSIIHKFSKRNIQLNVLENHLTQSWYFDFGLFVCGLAVFTCCCLKSTAALFSENCMSPAAITLCILNGIFIILQLHFLCSKNMRYISSHFQSFSVMHLYAANAAFWFYIVLWESSVDWQDASHIKHNSSLSWGAKDLNISIHSIESDVNSNESYFPKHVIHFTSNCWWHVAPESDVSTDILSIQLCLQNSSIGMLWKKILNIYIHLQYSII